MTFDILTWRNVSISNTDGLKIDDGVATNLSAFSNSSYAFQLRPSDKFDETRQDLLPVRICKINSCLGSAEQTRCVLVSSLGKAL